MKVMLINGSPNADGCCATALEEMKKVFASENIECESVWIGKKAINGCIGCNACKTTGVCVFHDIVNTNVEKLKDCVGMIVAYPVYFASANVALTCFLHRFFYSIPREYTRLKPAACIASCRRVGASATFDQLNKYF